MNKFDCLFGVCSAPNHSIERRLRSYLRHIFASKENLQVLDFVLLQID